MRMEVRRVGFEVMKRAPAVGVRIGGQIVHEVNVEGVSGLDEERRAGKCALVRWPLDDGGLPSSGVLQHIGGDLGGERSVQLSTGRLPYLRLWKPIAGGIPAFVGASTDNFGNAEGQKHKCKA